LSGSGTDVELEVRGLSKRYESGSAAVNELSFTVGKGEFFIIMGPSGSGKTTLLKCIAGLLLPDNGKIFLDNQEITLLPPHKRNISLIFQDFALFPHMTVFENIAFGLKLKKVPREEIEQEVKAILELIGLPGMAKRFPRQLSGGEKQRVAIARSLVLKPKVLLFDEPLANLDYRLQRKMEEELKELHHRLGLTFIYVTHNQEQALSLGDRVMLINKGIIEQIGSPLEIYMRPRNVFIARFLGEINLIRGKVIRKGEEEVEVKTSAGTFTGRSLDEGLQVDGEVTYAVRPEKVSLDAGVTRKANTIRGKFISLIYRGSEAE
jgi:ABC-type Fe3+/spermidine/putrescine transport system ATPase subunit